MLEKIDLTQKIDRAKYKGIINQLEIKIAELQREAKSLKIPIIIVLEGWGAAGKGTLINKLIISLDPRGYAVYSTRPPTEEELFRPFLWRYWKQLPEKGRIAVFDRSWYRRVLTERIDRSIKKRDWQNAYQDIKSFERQLFDDGYIIIKFFIHISKSEQKKRFKKLESNSATAWRVTKEDWKQNKQYQKYVKAIEEMLAKTDTDYAPWTIVEAHDRRFATVKVFQKTIQAMQEKIDFHANAKKLTKLPKKHLDYLEGLSSSILEKVDLTQTLSRSSYVKQLKNCQNKIRELEHEVYLRRLPVVIVYAGWDAAGKGGNIKRLVSGMDPRGYEVIPISAPNDTELAHHYLWRFWIKIPKAGHIAIYDRSWYGRVMVERIEGFCTEEEWKRAYREINEFEEQLVNFGTIVIKFWLHIDKNEQLQRFNERKENPHKNWKITEEDWRNREKWDDYQKVVEEMLYRTSTVNAPWTIVESNCKWFARIKTMKTVITEIEKRL